MNFNLKGEQIPHVKAFSHAQFDDAGNPLAIGCFDCGREYANGDWIEAIVPDDVWAQISPTRDEGGLLCIQCMAERCADLGLENVPVILTAGPLITR